MKSTEREKKSSPGKGKTSGKRPKQGKPGGKSARAGRAPENDLLGRTGQIGSIVTKGLDLAEASIKLGINLINKVGSTVPGQIIDKIAGSGIPGSSAYQQKPEEPKPQQNYQYGEEGETQQQDPQRGLYIVNRVPLFAGSKVNLSFSINNDSTIAAKKISLVIEDFIGVTNGFKIGSKTFSVNPADAIIAPVDFEKFVLTGSIPNKVPSDSYNSWIKVSGEEEIRIPVILMISTRS